MLENKKKIKTLQGLPENVVICKHCVMYNQRHKSVVEFKNKEKKKKPIYLDEEKICKDGKYKTIKNKQIEREKRK